MSGDVEKSSSSGGPLIRLGKPLGRLQQREDERAIERLKAHFSERGTLQSGYAAEALEILTIRVLRRRAINRLVAVGVGALVAVSFASAFTDNRVVEGTGTALVTAGSLAAVLAVVLRRPSDEAKDMMPDR